MTTRHRLSLGLLALSLCVPHTAVTAAPVVVEGVVQAESRVEIKARAAAPIRRIVAVEGRRVRAGDLLVELVNDVERAQVASAEAELERAEAALSAARDRADTTRRELERNLQVEDLLTAKELELSRDAARQAEGLLSIARGEATKARAQVELSRAVYENSFIRAPFDGVVARIDARIGMMPKPAETTLVTLLSLDRLYVEVSLPLEHLDRVAVGDAVRLIVEPGSATRETVAKGTVRFVFPEIDPGTGMVRVKIGIDERPKGVLPGMFANAEFDID